MAGSRFIHIPTAPSGGGGGATFQMVESSTVRLTVSHPLFDFGEYCCSHNHSWDLSFNGNFVEAGTGIAYTQWRRLVGGEEVLVRFYDDERKWWWEVAAALIEPHPNPFGTDIVSGFQGSEKDSSCDPSVNIPFGQENNSVFNFNEAPEVLLACGGSDPLEPNFCACSTGTDVVCALVTTLTFLTQGTIFHSVLPTSQGARKYDYVCTFAP